MIVDNAEGNFTAKRVDWGRIVVDNIKDTVIKFSIFSLGHKDAK